MGFRLTAALRILAAALSSILLCSCSPLYVMRAGYEEAQLLWRRQPITALLEDEALPQTTRDKLAMVLRVRAFGRDRLRLNVGGSYSSLASVEADEVVHVVTGAQRFRLEPYTWWFPIVGRVPYKGFFDKQEAIDAARELDAEGYDTMVRASIAFSTLGWFDDPLPSTLLELTPIDLADTILHELLHNTRYYASQAAFAESFANFVGQRGAIEFFRSEGDTQSAAQAEEEWQETLAYSDFLARLVSRLRAVYSQPITLEQRQEVFAQSQQELRDLGLKSAAYRQFTARPLNNAIILHHLLYYDRLLLFERLWQSHGADLRATIAVILSATKGQSDAYAAIEKLVGEHAGQATNPQ